MVPAVRARIGSLKTAEVAELIKEYVRGHTVVAELMVMSEATVSTFVRGTPAES